MPKRREKQRKFLEFDKRSHIPLRESNTETEERKSGRRAIPPTIENLSAHSEALVVYSTT